MYNKKDVKMAANFKRKGNELRDIHTRLIGKIDGKYIRDAHACLMGRIDGMYILDKHGVKIGRLDGDYIRDGHNLKIATRKDLTKAIDGTTGGIEDVALYLFFVR